MTRRLRPDDIREMGKGSKCMWCGSPMEVIHIHHINHDHTDNRIENLSLICPKCHRAEHKTNGLRMFNKYNDSDGYPSQIHFGEKIKALRKSKGWTYRHGAKELGISVSALQRYESGNFLPTLSVLNRISLGFDIPISELMESP